MPTFGNKAEGLIFLRKHNFLVPNFKCLSFEDMNSVSAQQLADEIIRDSKTELWAVRSSSAAEDGVQFSYAGQFLTEINIRSENLAQAIENVILAFENFSKNYGHKSEYKYGIIVQEMLRPDFSGVIFTQNPNDADDKAIYINLLHGLGEQLVSGRENAFQIRISGSKIEYLNADEEFTGSYFDSEIKFVKKTGQEIRSEIQPFVNELVKNAKLISKLRNFPADIEFAIAGGKIYWLQVRPITTLSKSESYIWDNSNIGENYPGVSLPLTASFVTYTYRIAYKAMSRFLGFTNSDFSKNENLFSQMSGTIYGAMYYNVTAWQKLLYQLPFGSKTTKMLTNAWNIDHPDFEKPPKPNVFKYIRFLANIVKALLRFPTMKLRFVRSHEELMKQYESFDFKILETKQLILKLSEIEQRALRDWITPMLNGLFTMVTFSALKKVVSKSRLATDYPNFANDVLFAQGDIISVKIVRNFREILNDIAQNKELLTLFNSNENLQAIENELPKFQEIHKKIKNYITLYGERCDGGELKMETVDYKENQLLFIDLLKKNLNNLLRNESKPADFDSVSILKQKYRRNILKRLLLQKLVRLAVKRMGDRENFRFSRTQTFALVRRLIRAIDSDLFEQKVIDNVNDTLFLTFEELKNSEIQKSYKALISGRKADYENFKNVERTNRYVQRNSEFQAFENQIITNSGEIPVGVGCSSGVVSAKVCIIDVQNPDFEAIDNKILVAKYFEPGWINIFSRAAGIISERGNLLSHTAILCREMGIPSIVGIKKITEFLQNDDEIQMNGATGIVSILKKKNASSD